MECKEVKLCTYDCRGIIFYKYRIGVVSIKGELIKLKNK